MQFQVPQFIETEDKIVGPLTLRQFLYMGLIAGFSFLLFFVVKPWLWILITVIFGGVGAAFAFVKVNGRPFSKIFQSAFRFYWEPQTYVWKTEEFPKAKKEEAIKEAMKKPSNTPLESIVMGMSLKETWQKLQTGTKQSLTSAKQFSEKVKERYQIFEKITGERQAARRVDYR